MVAVLDLRNLKPYLKKCNQIPPWEVLLLDSDGRTLISSYAKMDELAQLDPAGLKPPSITNRQLDCVSGFNT